MDYSPRDETDDMTWLYKLYQSNSEIVDPRTDSYEYHLDSLCEWTDRIVFLILHKNKTSDQA